MSIEEVSPKFHHLHHCDALEALIDVTVIDTNPGECERAATFSNCREKKRSSYSLLLSCLLITLFLCVKHNRFAIFLLFQQPSWEDDTDEFLKSMLTGSDLSGLGVSGSEAVCPSDTSSDSGCPEEQVRKMLMVTIEK